ncbi:MAG: Eco57I restriction-modification methylase domain-containing protein [Bacteroidales bacterium]|nr:Eco57I restriction-modification methylase domain-containing protein [Bacteroidales bacterium]
MNNELLNELIKDFSLETLKNFLINQCLQFEIEEQPISLPEKYLEKEFFSEILKIGKIEFNETSKLNFYTIKINNDLTERTSKKKQYELAKAILKETFADAGIFTFYDKNKNFRFTLIYIEYEGIKKKWSIYKRFSFYVNPQKINKTFIRQIGSCTFSSLEEIKNAFSIEPITKEFYTEIQNWYFYSLDKVYFPDDIKYSNDPARDKEIRNSEALIRLITRIIFIWFLKEKGLVSNELFNFDFAKKTVKNFFKNNGKPNYYNTILQNLFFGVLNQKMGERQFATEADFNANKIHYGVKNFLRYKEHINNPDELLKIFEQIPFLNGGLFDCLDIIDSATNKVIYVDGFSRNYNKMAYIPDELFFNSDYTIVDLSKYGLSSKCVFRGLIDILNSYNFTTDENTPVEQEIALDPELLGKVFENLLACYVPESSTTARKATGSYYTPREIVDYMVKQSLLEYLKQILDKSPETEEKLNNLLSYSDEQPEFTESEKVKIIEALDKIKILDPACGSGAFPMGILLKITHTLQKLDPDNNHWRNLQTKKVTEKIQSIFKEHNKDEREKLFKQINEAFDESISYPDYARKLYLIENSIYGVDIQTSAIQIAKLRFFISLVIDQKPDSTKENLGIRALPNLETKFIAANTLISLYENKDNTSIKSEEIINYEEELKSIRHKYYSAKTRYEKIQLQKKDEEIRKKIKDYLLKNNWPAEVANKLASFNPYDPNVSVGWFDAEWMFGITNGFDIVIGNPPYIQLQKDSGRLAKLYENQNYETFVRTGDIYVLFYEKGLSLLKINGILCYITSNKWMRARYGEKLRNFFTKFNPLLLIDLGPGIFESATVDTNILLIQKCKPSQGNDDIPHGILADKKAECTLNVDNNIQNNIKFSLKAVTLQKQKGNIDIDSQVRQHSVLLNKLTKDAWFIGSSAEQRLKEKIEHIGKPLKEWDVNIYYGIKTGLNEAFIITTEKRNEILANCKDKEERKRTEAIIKPILRGRDIKRYYYDWAGLWVIGTFPALKLNIEDYPALKEYFLDNFDIRQLEQSGKKYPELGFDARKKTGNKWFETQDQIAYYHEFEKEKVVWQELAQGSQFAFDQNGEYFVSNTAYILTGENLKFILGYLNSKLNEYTYDKWYCTKLGEKGTRWLNQHVMEIPLPPITPSNNHIVKHIESLVNKILTAKKQNPQANITEYEKEINRLVYLLYELTEEEVRMIEMNN